MIIQHGYRAWSAVPREAPILNPAATNAVSQSRARAVRPYRFVEDSLLCWMEAFAARLTAGGLDCVRESPTHTLSPFWLRSEADGTGMIEAVTRNVPVRVDAMVLPTHSSLAPQGDRAVIFRYRPDVHPKHSVICPKS